MRYIAHIGLSLCLSLPVGADQVQDNLMIPIIESEGSLVQLEHAASTVFVADPNIASLQVVSNKTVFVLAHMVGKTTLYALDENDDIILQKEIVVHKSLQHLQQQLREQSGS
ncbi:pilus assembly protein N-terminal domain-containing protein [Parasulfitobacter algicola]|uniref:Pilus assembly protein N-terminal domain-containing protein n=1 Tax=Parasulfitobacter algicola TaxID=2614809 RepID=A0ABX2IV33_9RHOB|nr:pilus assembly protein N-terminal domain-containing protein [Sulfitobacter algicola]NSX56774.1 pilus assembly protein N-terminal domain-containing protein [Sulfitobacter algicola]